MTRSEVSVHSPRIVRKAFRADARTRGLTYPEAVARAKERATADGIKPSGPTDGGRRNPGRMDGVTWNGDSFVSPGHVDGDVKRPHTAYEFGTYDAADELHAEYADDGEVARPDKERVVSLLDMARPAKRKGAAKYVILPNVPRVVHLESDDDGESEQFEQWDEVSDMQSEQWEQWESQSEAWENQSEQWEIPAGDSGNTAAEWQELYTEKFERAPSRSYSAALRGNQR
ncbi:hypothetical protein GGX14DRAFT_700160 [Mycena pura]|uniref:Uncharacterized protein n=1 Tax=Mycena pura TaxID=153505 RepID=A0AAD6UY92_9AGAR|nr:hypothetical protein GGX14DRAFT_700160 [Mycena pura]